MAKSGKKKGKGKKKGGGRKKHPTVPICGACRMK